MVLCKVYRSGKMAETYLYLAQEAVLDDLPAALRQVFGEARIWTESQTLPDMRVTYVISAGDAHTAPARVHSLRGPRREWHDVTAALAQQGTPMAALPVLTDDRVPIERLLSGLLYTELGR